MVEHRHRRAAPARPRPTAALAGGVLALTATLAAVSVGVLSGSATPGSAPQAGASLAAQAAAPSRSAQASRAGARRALPTGSDLAPKAAHVAREEARERAERIRERRATTRAVAGADTRLYATADLDVWSAPRAGAQQGLVEDGDKVLVTGRQRDGRTEIVVAQASHWVTSGYLSKDKPLGAGAGLSMAPCPDGSVENGLTSSAVYVYRSVCRAFPQVTSYGGWDAHGEHSSGKAIDIMTSDVALGTAIAAFLQAHAAELNLYDVIWRQHIWTPVRAGEGWRSMSDRGSSTANHYDHVHVAVN